jgi:hypothetical protein
VRAVAVTPKTSDIPEVVSTLREAKFVIDRRGTVSGEKMMMTAPDTSPPENSSRRSSPKKISPTSTSDEATFANDSRQQQQSREFGANYAASRATASASFAASENSPHASPPAANIRDKSGHVAGVGLLLEKSEGTGYVRVRQIMPGRMEIYRLWD